MLAYQLVNPGSRVKTPCLLQFVVTHKPQVSKSILQLRTIFIGRLAARMTNSSACYIVVVNRRRKGRNGKAREDHEIFLVCGHLVSFTGDGNTYVRYFLLTFTVYLWTHQYLEGEGRGGDKPI